MKTKANSLTELFGFCTAAQVFELGGIAAAFSNRKHTRKKLKKAELHLASARRDYSTYGMYEDCGDSYEQSKNEAEGARYAALQAKIEAEKFYKKLTHEFIEAGGSIDILVSFVQILQHEYKGS